MIHYTITNLIISKLEIISSIWGVIENAKIIPEWETKLKKIARLKAYKFETTNRINKNRGKIGINLSRIGAEI